MKTTLRVFTIILLTAVLVYPACTKGMDTSDMTSTASGLKYKVIKMGDGPKPTIDSKVKVHYEGSLTNGKVFDSSYKRGQPISFPLGRVIRGWQEGVQLMPVGSKFKFFIPSELGYGSRGAGASIPPNSDLIFIVELFEIVE